MGKFKAAYAKKFGKAAANGVQAHKPKEGSPAEEKGESKAEAKAEGDKPFAKRMKK